MIENFEELTYELTDFERNKVIPFIVSKLQHNIGRNNAVKNQRIIDAIHQSTTDFKASPARVRKYINYIRVTGLVKCLIATSKGYYRANKLREMDSYIRSLKQRENAIRTMREALEKQYKLSTSKGMF